MDEFSKALYRFRIKDGKWIVTQAEKKVDFCLWKLKNITQIPFLFFMAARSGHFSTPFVPTKCCPEALQPENPPVKTSGGASATTYLVHISE
jgi:hypothetical protein